MEPTDILPIINYVISKDAETPKLTKNYKNFFLEITPDLQTAESAKLRFSPYFINISAVSFIRFGLESVVT